MTEDDVVKLLRKRCAEAGSRAAWARTHDVATGYVTDVINMKKPPRGKILAALGLKRVVNYMRAEKS